MSAPVLGDEWPWPATKALSVYNALSLAQRDMTRAEILAYLRQLWEPDTGDAYVAAGVEFLSERGFVIERSGLVMATEREPTGFCRRLRRIMDDHDLAYVEA